MTDATEKSDYTPSTRKNKCSSKACRYFNKGFCGYGDKCSYRHIEPKSKPSSFENCPFYKRASCKFASKCWYKHIRPNGKVYPKPGPLNKFIVVGPSGEEPDRTADTQPPIQDSAASTVVFPQGIEIRRSFRRPRNQDRVSDKCFYYEEKGTCYHGDKCWYRHSEPYTPPADELLHEPTQESEIEPDPDHTKMCYDFIFTECEFGDECPYVHGDICQFCDLPFLHPFDEQQRKEHLEACEMFFLEDMDNAFKFMNSKDKMCAICLEYVWGPDKLFTKQKFGIQEKCNHIFCLRCIRRWREVKRKAGQPQACPACREESRFVVPCARWFESDREKVKWVEEYKAVLANKPCKFYARGKCRNEDKCQYFHSEFGMRPVNERNDLEDYWQDIESSDQLPFGELDEGWQDTQEQGYVHDTPSENQIQEYFRES